MESEQTCRYCEEQFTPRQGKPGRIDECEPCLFELSAPKQPIIDQDMERHKKIVMRKWKKAGFSDSQVDRLWQSVVDSGLLSHLMRKPTRS